MREVFHHWAAPVLGRKEVRDLHKTTMKLAQWFVLAETPTKNRNSVIHLTLDRYLVRLGVWLEEQFENGLPLWNREIFAPQTGLSEELLVYDKLVTKLLEESRLRDLNEAIALGKFSTVKQELPVINHIFSAKEGSQELSSYTRISAIAVLFHAIHLPQVSSKANEIAELILKNENRVFFLFDHEKTLLNKIFTDFQRNDPRGQVPISEYVQEASVFAR
ncbi:hypothetical protein PCANC_00948 [Puccinia coronata f. sp. avenae]|uniref:Uncharacterized protein n=1 Tax=Puccinia coronata f. sp. avenae TaxID=200324 RepID=A0A2N5W6F3_9BASI|nr:hypothetical protein PCANC_00948 [Puccinia coronata f. sp. avenae]